MNRRLLLIALAAAASSVACAAFSDPPKTPAEAIGLAQRSGPELTAAAAMLDAGALATATAAGAKCPDVACRARAAADALEPYYAAAEAMAWGAAAQGALGGGPKATPPDARGVYGRLGFVPDPADPGRWCAAGVCLPGPGATWPGSR